MTPKELEDAKKNRARVAAWEALPGNKERKRAGTKTWMEIPENKRHKETRQKERYRERRNHPEEAARIRSLGRRNAKAYRENPSNKDKIRESQRRQDAKPQRKVKKNERVKKKYRENKEFAATRRAWIRRYYAENQEYRSKTIARALVNQKTPEGKKRRLERHRERYATDPAYKFSWLIRQSIRRAFQGTSKTSTTRDLLGVTLELAMQSIERRFTDGMNWANYGDWHIDHIFPISAVNIDDEIEKRAVCHIDNLQPLWGEENSGKHNKVFPEARRLFDSIIEQLKNAGDGAAD